MVSHTVGSHWSIVLSSILTLKYSMYHLLELGLLSCVFQGEQDLKEEEGKWNVNNNNNNNNDYNNNNNDNNNNFI